MVFDRAQIITKQPTAVRNIEVNLKQRPHYDEQADSEVFIFEATIDVEIAYSDGSSEHKKFNLLSHLTSSQQNQLKTFMDAIRSKAVNEVLP
jgi:hypothetical protein